MARSLAHRFGQIIGDLIEEAIEPFLTEFARSHDLYLDVKGPRSARKGKKITWTDHLGNRHDLDFVLERGGSEDTIGAPIAFIETAWRRYSKHSRNKAQELEGSIHSLAVTYQDHCPFLGVILAGVFTGAAINQLRSLGFHVLYIPYDSIVASFKSEGVDARSEEGTPEKDFQAKIKALTFTRRKNIIKALQKTHREEIATFLAGLDQAVARKIARIHIIALHGRVTEFSRPDEAAEFISAYNLDSIQAEVHKFVIQIYYSNGDKIDAEFADKNHALDFLARCH